MWFFGNEFVHDFSGELIESGRIWFLVTTNREAWTDCCYFLEFIFKDLIEGRLIGPLQHLKVDDCYRMIS